MRNSNLYLVSLVLVAILGGLLFGYDTAVISGAEQALQKHLGLNAFWHGVTASSALIANWEHPCKYIFVNAIGKVYVYERTMFPTKPSMEQMELLNKADVWNEYEGKPIVHDIPKNYSRSTSSEHLYAVIISGGGDKFNNHIR